MKRKQRAWKVNYGGRLPYPVGTRMDVMRRDGRVEYGVPCGSFGHSTWHSIIAAHSGVFERPGHVVMYRRHVP